MRIFLSLTGIAIMALSILSSSCENADSGINSKNLLIQKEKVLLAEKNAQKQLISDSIKQLNRGELIEFEKQVQQNFKENLKSDSLNPNSIKWQEIVIHKYVGIDNYNRLNSDEKQKAITDIINKFIEIDSELKVGFNKSATQDEIIELEKELVSKREVKRNEIAKAILDIYL